MARFPGKFSWHSPTPSRVLWLAYSKLLRHQPNPPHSRWRISHRRPQHRAGVTRPHSTDATESRKGRSRTHMDMGFTPHYPSQRFWVIIHSPTDSQPPSRRGGFFVSTVDLLNRPTGMFRDEWLSIFGGSLQSSKG